MRARWDFVGRAEESVRLRHAAVGTENSGLFIGGAAGIGKSRLLNEVVSTLDPAVFAVVQATGSMATSALPFGSLAPILPSDQQSVPSQSGLLRWASDALQSQAHARRLVLILDDAHLVDPLSAALIGNMVRAERATVLATMRSGRQLPDPLETLWREGLVEWCELGPLTEQETTDLLTEMLGGMMDVASANRLWRLSQGNALLLRELIRAADLSGELIEARGMWRWTGEIKLAPSLTQVIDRQIGRLSDDERTVLELTAFGEPIGLPLLVAATDQAAVEAVEGRQLIQVSTDRRRTMVRLSHPLYGEALRESCPKTRRRRLFAELATLVEALGARRRDDVLRVAVWRLDSGTKTDPALLLKAAQQAFSTFDLPLACRLATAAVDAGGGFDAAETLGTLLMFIDQPSKALTVLDAAVDLIRSDEQRVRWMVARTFTCYWGLGQLTSADQAFQEAATIADERNQAWLQSLEAMLRMERVEPVRAKELANLALTNPAADESTRALAMATLAYHAAASGRPTDAMRHVTAAEAISTGWRVHAPYVQLALELARANAMILAADFAAVDAMVTAEFAGTSAGGGQFPLGTGYLAVVCGQAARLRGKLEEAKRWTLQAQSSLHGSRVFGSFANAEVAHVLALAGDRESAREAMCEADEIHSESMQIFYPWLELARCWTFAGSDTTTARQMLAELVVRLRSDGLFGYELFALHDLVRLGSPELAVDRLEQLVDVVQGNLPPVLARHARAAADRNGRQLLAVAQDLADLGVNLYAIEAVSTAASMLRAAKSPHTSAALDLRRELVGRCDGLHSPVAQVAPAMLTERERQVAELAAVGVSSKDIAHQLFLSARTIDNHLLKVYQKLGISGRVDLPSALRES